MKKLLSVIIPTYNMETLLDQCLTSLIIPDEGERAKLDVIVVIDGATDRSPEIAHSYESRYPETFRVLDKKNGNYGSCINAALPLILKGGDFCPCLRRRRQLLHGKPQCLFGCS